MLAPTTPVQLAGGFAAAADPAGLNPRANASVADTASNERLIAVLPLSGESRSDPTPKCRPSQARSSRRCMVRAAELRPPVRSRFRLAAAVSLVPRCDSAGTRGSAPRRAAANRPTRQRAVQCGEGRRLPIPPNAAARRRAEPCECLETVRSGRFILATQTPERASQEGPPFSAAPPSSPSVATWHPVPR